MNVDGCAQDLPRGGLVQRAVHGADIAPQAEQIELALAQGLTDATPRVGVRRDARPAVMCDGW